MWAENGLSCRRQVVHPRPRTPQRESVAKPETPLLIILSIACKWGPWQQVILCTSGPNLVVLARTGDELLRWQAQNGVNSYFAGKFDLEALGQSPHKPICILTKVFYAYGPNLVILACRGDKLSCRQTWWRTDGRRQRQYPEANTSPG